MKISKTLYKAFLLQEEEFGISAMPIDSVSCLKSIYKGRFKRIGKIKLIQMVKSLQYQCTDAPDLDAIIETVEFELQ